MKMQWALTCILLASTALISASDNGDRSKRDLSFLKSHLLSKIFGSSATANDSTPVTQNKENYRLFRIPGHNNILVKAVPKVTVMETDGPPHGVLEITETKPVPVNPSIAIVSKYLGTDKLNDTLFALKGVKDLLQSGVLTAQRDGIDGTEFIKNFPSVVVESSDIVIDGNRRPFKVNPWLGETLIKRYDSIQDSRYPQLPLPSQYSYKQVNKGEVMSYTANDIQNVIVTEAKRPIPLPEPISYRIQDILLTYHQPTTPVMQKTVRKHPASIPFLHIPNLQNPYQKVSPPYKPSAYSYNQVHADGSMTKYSGLGHLEEHGGDTVVITRDKKPMPVLEAEVERHLAPMPVFNIPEFPIPSYHVKVPSHGSGYSYNYIHGDGCEHVLERGEKPAVVITKIGRPTVVVAEERPPAPFPIPKIPNVKVTSGAGYSYNQVHNDGTVTTYSGSGHVKEHAERKPAEMITVPGRPTVVVPDVSGPPAPIPVFNAPKVEITSSPGFSYNHVHNDGTVTTYSGSFHVKEHAERKPAAMITVPGRPTVVVPDVNGPPAPIPVFNAPKVEITSSPGFSYNHVHNDGTVTTYSGSGHVMDHVERKPAVMITEPGRPTVVVADVNGPPAPIPVFNAPRVEINSSPGFSYNHVHNDGSVTTYSGSGHVMDHVERKPAVMITEPGRPTVVVPDVNGPPAPIPVFNAPKVETASSPGFSYNHMHNDESVTTYSGSGHMMEHVERKPAVMITEPGRPTLVVPDVNGPTAPIPIFSAPKVEIASSPGFSYNHVHSDGSVTTYSGSGHVNDKPAAVITKVGRPTVVVSDFEGPPAPIPVFNAPKVSVSAGPGNSYNRIRNESGKVVEQEEKPAMVITKPGRPTVFVSDEGRPAPFPIFNAPTVSSGPGYSYNHVHNDGSITTYSGSGNVQEHKGAVVVTETKQPLQLPTFLAHRIESVAATAAGHHEEKTAMVITEPGRPTIVVPDIHTVPEAFSVIDSQKGMLSSAPGYTYNQVHSDGTMKSYSGSGQVSETEEEKTAMVITQPGRPTIVVPDVDRPPAPFPVINTSTVTVQSAPGYSYNHVHRDGTINAYESGQVLELEREKPATVITKPGRPTIVVADANGPPAPFPIFSRPTGAVTSGHGYTYNQVHNDGSVNTYYGSGHVLESGVVKPAAVITKPGRPTFVISDTDGSPAPFPVFNGPEKESLSGPSFSYNHVNNYGTVHTHYGSGHMMESEKPAAIITEPGRPTAVVSDVDGTPAPFPIINDSGPRYTYSHVHNNGSITSYSGSGYVKEHQGAVVVTETKQPMPLPTFLASRIQNAAATVISSGPSSGFHGPTLVTHEQSVVVEKTPEFVNHGERDQQNIEEQINVEYMSQNYEQSQANAKVPSGFSYQTVHQDGSATSYTDRAEAHIIHDRPMLYPTGPGSASDKEQKNRKVKCNDPAHTHQEFNVKEQLNTVEVNTKSNSSNFSYTMVSGGDTSTTYFGSGNDERRHVENAAHAQQVTMPDAPVLVTHTDDTNPQNVRITPYLSQYMYKQINHHRPNELTIVDLGNAPAHAGQVDVKLTSSADSVMTTIENVKEADEVPKDYVYVPPSMHNDLLLPTIKPVEVHSSSKSPVAVVSTRTSVSHSFKTRRRHRVRTTTSASVVKTSAPLSTTPSISTSTEETSKEGSLSTNPIVVLPEENVFSFKQDRADGSSITVVGNKDSEVSVVEETKSSPSRGDIPDSSY